MIDIVLLHLKAGAGGNGRVSFRREKYVQKGGPDGGVGGHGGSIIVRADSSQTTLRSYAGVHEVLGKSGEPGGKKQCSGAAGEDIVLTVPVGTVLWLMSENQAAKRRRLSHGLEELAYSREVRREQFALEREGVALPPKTPDEAELPPTYSVKSLATMQPSNGEYKKLIALTKHGQEVVVCQGGFGGRGNLAFKSSRETTPLKAEFGTAGEERYIIFELQLLADMGLVGFPNAGKSTLLSVLSQARPKIGAYPFTTLEPELGIVANADNSKQFVLADIPGLISGASEGKGLGLAFLRHVRNTTGLLYVLSVPEEMLAGDPTPKECLANLQEQFKALQGELKAYDELLLEKRWAVCLTKKDLYSDEIRKALESAKFDGEKPMLVSAATHDNLEVLRKRCFQILQ